MIKVQVRKLHKDAKMPLFARAGDAGMDLFACEEVTILQGKRTQVRTGIALAIPEGHVGLIWDKSGLSHTKGLKTLGGVVDAGYRGEVLVGLVNLGEEPHTFHVGDKVAQMLIQKVEHADLCEVDTLEDSERGEQGFGSSGR